MIKKPSAILDRIVIIKGTEVDKIFIPRKNKDSHFEVQSLLQRPNEIQAKNKVVAVKLKIAKKICFK